MKAHQQIESFIRTKNSQSTKSHYSRTLRLLLDFCYEMGCGFNNDIDFCSLIPISTNDDVVLYYAPLDPQFIEEFLIFRKWAGDSQCSLSKYYGQLNNFFQYLVHHKYFPYNPVELVEPIARPISKETTYLTKEESILLLASAAISDFPERDFALVKVLICYGLRPRELRELRVEDIDFFNKQIYICRWKKTGRVLILPLYEQVASDIYNYLNHDRRKNQYCKQVFLNEDDSPITSNDMLYLVKDLCQRAGIQKSFTPAGFRHSMATMMFVNGLDVWTIKELLGHRKLGTTLIYTHGWTSIPDDPRLTPNAELLSEFLQKNIRKIKT